VNVFETVWAKSCLCSRKLHGGIWVVDIRLWLGTMMSCEYHKRHTGSVVDEFLQNIWIKWINFLSSFPLMPYGGVVCDFGVSISLFVRRVSCLLHDCSSLESLVNSTWKQVGQRFSTWKVHHNCHEFVDAWDIRGRRMLCCRLYCLQTCSMLACLKEMGMWALKGSVLENFILLLCYCIMTSPSVWIRGMVDLSCNSVNLLFMY